MNKIFTNQQLKKLINDLYIENNIIINDELQKLLLKSSKTHYDKLYYHYNDIKNQITERLINKSNSDDEYEIIQPKNDTPITENIIIDIP